MEKRAITIAAATWLAACGSGAAPSDLGLVGADDDVLYGRPAPA